MGDNGGDCGEQDAILDPAEEEVAAAATETEYTAETAALGPLSKPNENSKINKKVVGLEESIDKSVNMKQNIRPRSLCDGGTKQLKLHNVTKGSASNDVVKETALERVKQKIGEDKFKDLKERWRIINSQKKKSKKELQSEGDGVIKTILGLGFSKVEVMTFLGVGGPRVNRIMQNINKPESSGTVRKPPAHAATEDDLKRVLDHVTSLDLEPGFPC